MVLGQLVLGLGLGIGVGLLFELREYIIDLGILMGMICATSRSRSRVLFDLGKVLKFL